MSRIDRQATRKATAPKVRTGTSPGERGCVKSTQLLLLARHLQQRGIAFVTTREPGGTPLGEQVRELLLDPRLVPAPAAELFLFEAARAQLVADVVKPAS